MTVGDVLNPNKVIPDTSRIWYALSLIFLMAALYIAFNAGWQHGAVFVPDNGNLRKIEDAVDISLRPRTTTMVIAVVFYASLLVRRCIRNVSNIPTLLLVVGNVLLVSTLIESILPEQNVPLLKFFGLDVFTVSPQKVLIFVILFSWVGMRAIAGFGVLFLIWAFVTRMSNVNVALGMFGSLYVLFSFLTLMLQMKLPYMKPEGGFLSALKQDFGLIVHEAQKDVAASGDAVKKTVAVTLEAANAAIAATVPVAGVATTAAVGKIKEGLLDGSTSESNSNTMLKA